MSDFYRAKLSEFTQKTRATHDVSNQPVVYVEISELAPVRSRLQKVRVLKLAPAYAGV